MGEGYVATPPPADQPTFTTVRDAYWVAQQRRVTRGKLKPHSLGRDKRAAELHLAAFDDLPFVDIDMEDVEAWVDAKSPRGQARSQFAIATAYSQRS